jgi:hypothetical protein
MGLVCRAHGTRLQRTVAINHPFAVTRDGRTIIVSNAGHLSGEIWLLEPKR